MPIRQGGTLASRASTWPRDHFCRSTMAPRASWQTMWNEFLPISMPITAIALSNFWDMACSLSLAPLPSILSLVGQEHGRTIPLTDIGPNFSLLSQFEFWRPRRWQRFVSFHDVDGWQALRGLVPDPTSCTAPGHR